MVVDLASDVALEASEGFLLGEPFLHATVDVVGGARVADHAGENDLPQRGVGLSVTAAVETVTFLLPAAGIDGRRATERRERRSSRSRSGLSPAATSNADAHSVPIPGRATSSGAVPGTRGPSMASNSAISASS